MIYVGFYLDRKFIKKNYEKKLRLFFEVWSAGVSKKL